MDNNVEKWGLHEISLQGPSEGNPFAEIRLCAIFRHDKSIVDVTGFYDGDGTYKIRFMPDLTGKWSYVTQSNSAVLDGITGNFVCVEPSDGNHGPVRVKDTFHFEFSDTTPYYPFGTTCYAWIHQSTELQEQTLETLSHAPFNKMRMCLFPKHYDYNHNEPSLYPFLGSLEDGFDFTRPNPSFFQHLEGRILDLQMLGIECDLILFHPYDRWGFSKMGPENDDNYLKYIVSRLSAFRNIWWALANEYDILNMEGAKKPEDWERFARIIQRHDPYEHLRSIHNCIKFYDNRKPWITHCSIQRTDRFKTSEYTNEWRDQYEKPVVIDECVYEGNINHGWGNITGEEMTRRFWEGFMRGGYVGHGETFVHPQDILWWAHGGELHGTSPDRIAFLRKIVEESPSAFNPAKPMTDDYFENWDATVASAGSDYIYYLGFSQPMFRDFSIPDGKNYKAEIIDTWNMTITPVPEIVTGSFRINLPGKQYIAVRFRSV